MKTWPIVDDQGKLVAFEVSIMSISLARITRLLTSLGASDFCKRRPFSYDEVHIAFVYRGASYVVWEPFGDNSRYWIGPADKAPERPEDLARIEKAFRSYQPSLLRRLLALDFQKHDPSARPAGGD
jgi:hypothetical protein